jgi:hypothetical protein
MSRFKSATVALAALGLLSVVPTSAKADLVLSLSNCNAGCSGFPSPYGSVDVQWVNSTTADVTFTAVNGYHFGGGGALGLNVNGTFSLSSFSSTSQAGFLSPTPISVVSGNEDGFGSFNLSVDFFDGYQHSAQTASFVLTATGGTTWADANAVLTNNLQGNEAAGHIFVCSATPCDFNGSALSTGFATNGVAPAVPELSTWGMMILGFIGVGALGYGRRSQRQFRVA